MARARAHRSAFLDLCVRRQRQCEGLQATSRSLREEMSWRAGCCVVRLVSLSKAASGRVADICRGCTSRLRGSIVPRGRQGVMCSHVREDVSPLAPWWSSHAFSCFLFCRRPPFRLWARVDWTRRPIPGAMLAPRGGQKEKTRVPRWASRARARQRGLSTTGQLLEPAGGCEGDPWHKLE